MNIIFFGNTKFSAIGARIIHNHFAISQVVTLPDQLDKKHGILESPVKKFAKENTIPVIEASKLTSEIIAQIAAAEPDFLIVEDYGLILPRTLLALPKYAPLNIHHSLLPKYRGPAPAPSAILAGKKVSGVSIIHMNEQVDAGDIYAQKEYVLQPEDTTETLLTTLNTLGGELILSVIQDILNGNAIAKKQDETQATLTHYMKKEDGFFDSNTPPSPEQLDRMIRAYYPWPGVWTRMEINGQQKIVKFLPEQKLQVEGKKPMSLKDFYNGYPQLKALVEKLFVH